MQQRLFLIVRIMPDAGLGSGVIDASERLSCTFLVPLTPNYSAQSDNMNLSNKIGEGKADNARFEMLLKYVSE